MFNLNNYFYLLIFQSYQSNFWVHRDINLDKIINDQLVCHKLNWFNIKILLLLFTHASHWLWLCFKTLLNGRKSAWWHVDSTFQTKLQPPNFWRVSPLSQTHFRNNFIGISRSQVSVFYGTPSQDFIRPTFKLQTATEIAAWNSSYSLGFLKLPRPIYCIVILGRSSSCVRRQTQFWKF